MGVEVENALGPTSDTDELGGLRFPLWLQTIADDELRVALRDANLNYNSADPIRNAFVMLENRLRTATGSSQTAYGTDLVKIAFDPQVGVLQPVSDAGSERAGFRDIFDGAFKLYRNAAAHQSNRHDAAEARRILALVDHCLSMVGQAVERTVPIQNFVGANEGVIHHRRDFRLDIDGDGTNEIVVLLGHRQVLDGGNLEPHLSTVVLKDAGAGLRRIIAERICGTSLYGPMSAEVRNCTAGPMPDLVIRWSVGESQSQIFVLRLVNNEYVIARKNLSQVGPEYYSASSELAFGTHPTWQQVEFADIDGDGIIELIQEFRYPREELEALSVDARLLSDPDSRPFRAIVWKWGPASQLFEIVSNVWVADRRS